MQKRMKENRSNKTNMARTERVYLLSGVLRCGKCGGSYIGFTSRSQKGYETKYYACGNKRRLHTCDAKNINGEDLESQILGTLRGEIMSRKMIEKTADMIMDAYKPVDDIIDGVKKELANYEKKIRNLVKTLASGLGSESIREALSDLEIQKKALIEKLNLAKQTGRKTDRVKLLVEKIKKDAAEISNGTADMQQMIKRYIHEIKITDEKIVISAIGDLSTIGCGGGI